MAWFVLCFDWRKGDGMQEKAGVEKASILVIDDDTLLTRTLKKLLTSAGYFVDIASDGHEGIRKAKSGFFHLILCDIRMPELDGIMTLRHIKRFQERAGINSGFVVITAYDSEETRKSAYHLGVTEFVRKPFDRRAFLDVIEKQAVDFVRRYPADAVSDLNARLSRLIESVKPSEEQ